jgi:hypothetical protein
MTTPSSLTGAWSALETLIRVIELLVAVLHKTLFTNNRLLPSSTSVACSLVNNETVTTPLAMVQGVASGSRAEPRERPVFGASSALGELHAAMTSATTPAFKQRIEQPLSRIAKKAAQVETPAQLLFVTF